MKKVILALLLSWSSYVVPNIQEVLDGIDLEHNILSNNDVLKRLIPEVLKLVDYSYRLESHPKIWTRKGQKIITVPPMVFEEEGPTPNVTTEEFSEQRTEEAGDVATINKYAHILTAHEREEISKIIFFTINHVRKISGQEEFFSQFFNFLKKNPERIIKQYLVDHEEFRRDDYKKNHAFYLLKAFCIALSVTYNFVTATENTVDAILVEANERIQKKYSEENFNEAGLFDFIWASYKISWESLNNMMLNDYSNKPEAAMVEDKITAFFDALAEGGLEFWYARTGKGFIGNSSKPEAIQRIVNNQPSKKISHFSPVKTGIGASILTGVGVLGATQTETGNRILKWFGKHPKTTATVLSVLVGGTAAAVVSK